MIHRFRARSLSSLKPYLLRSNPKHRLQHHGPHKYYFQDPPSQQTEQPVTVGPYHLERPLHRRLLRSIGWAVLFCALGVGAADHMKGAVRRAKVSCDPVHEKIETDFIAEKFQQDPLVQYLEQDPEWTNAQRAPNPETDPYPFVRHIDPYSTTAMGGPRGFQSKCYMNKAKLMMIFMVHFGEGVEGEPYFVHEGAVASFLDDSLDWMSALFLKAPGSMSDQSSATLSNKTLQVDYTRPLRSGQLYCFWMLPAFAISHDVPVADIMHDPNFGVRKMTEQEVKRTLVGMIEQRITPPVGSTATDAGVTDVGIPYARARVTYDPPLKAGSFLLDLEDTASEPEGEIASP